MQACHSAGGESLLIRAGDTIPMSQKSLQRSMNTLSMNTLGCGHKGTSQAVAAE